MYVVGYILSGPSQTRLHVHVGSADLGNPQLLSAFLSHCFSFTSPLYCFFEYPIARMNARAVLGLQDGHAIGDADSNRTSV